MSEPRDAAQSDKPARDRPDLPAAYGVDRAATAGLLPWSYVAERMASARNYWVATTRPDGRPHVSPVWGLWLDGTFYFSSDPTSRKGRNLAARPEAAVHLESGDDVVIVEGTIERVADAGTLARFADDYDTKYAIRLDLTDPNYAVYRLRPRAAYAWEERTFPQSMTRWRFNRP
jgi:PPOX class probable F420-dependent enzyme